MRRWSLISAFVHGKRIVNPRHSFSDSKGHERGRRMPPERSLSNCLKGRFGSVAAAPNEKGVDRGLTLVTGPGPIRHR
ncbi:hypothetical protein BLAT2472_20088 [Burkholderia latens]